MEEAHLAAGKKNAIARRATIAFLDESGFGCKPMVLRTWAPRGQTPILITGQRDRRVLSAISAVTWRPTARKNRRRFNFYFRVHVGATNSDLTIAFLRHLLRQIRGPIDLVWDNLAAHKSAATRRFVERHPRLRLHFLPPYCPELNPDEYAWNHLKRRELPNYAANHLSQTQAALSMAVVRVRGREPLLESFVRAAGIRV